MLTLLIITTQWGGLDATTAALPYPTEMACGEALAALPMPPDSIGQCERTGVLSASPVPMLRKEADQ